MAKVVCMALLAAGLSFGQECIDYVLPFKGAELQTLQQTGQVEVLEEDKIPTLHLRGRGEQRQKNCMVDVPVEDIGRFAGRKIRISYEFRLKDVPCPDPAWNGFKAMIRYEAAGQTFHGHAETPWGTSDWRTGAYFHEIKDGAANGLIRFFIPGGEAWVRNVHLFLPGIISSLDIGGNVLCNNFTTIRASKILSYKPTFTVRGNSPGFECDSLNWNADEIKQIEAELSSDSPGFYELTFTREEKGKPVSSLIRKSAVPDGRSHRVIFEVGRNGDWRGKIRKLSLCHMGGRVVNQLGLSSIQAFSRENILGNGNVFSGGMKVEVPTLRPRAIYRFTWLGDNVLPASIVFLDKNYRVISRTPLKADGRPFDFQVPMMSMTAELQLAGAGACQPCLELVDLNTRQMEPSQWVGKWIWCQNSSGPENTIVWFKREFELTDTPIDEAAILATADDGFVAYVNGKTVGWNGHWPTPKKFDIAEHLKPGHNIIEFRVRNATQNGGLICDAFVLQGDRLTRLDSNAEWRMKIGDGEEKPTSIDQEVVVLGDCQASPWAGSLGYEFSGPAGILELKSTAKNAFTAVVKRPPLHELPSLTFALKTTDDKYRYFALPVTMHGRMAKGEQIRVEYQMPDSPGGLLFLQDPYVRLTEERPVGTISSTDSHKGEMAPVRLTACSTRPMLQCGKETFSPIGYYLPGTFSRAPMKESWRAREAASTGARVLIMKASFDEFWLGENQFDFEAVNRRMQVALDLNPKARIMINLYCFMPNWWLEKNPDERTQWSNGKFPAPNHVEKQALASDKWLADARIGIRALAENVRKSDWGKSLFAISVAESRNSEWFWNTLDYYPGHLPGYSKADYRAFREFLHAKYHDDAELARAWSMPGTTFENLTMPMLADFDKSSFGMLADPAKDRRLMDWFEYRNWALGRAIISLCRSVKEEFGTGVMAGAYYGYYVEFNMPSRRCNQDVGHNNVVEIARSPYVDFVRAPSKYGYRMTGDADLIVHPQDTFSLRNKLVYVEQDFRSYRENGEKAFVWGRHSTVSESIGAMNRAFGMMLAQNVSHYWYDFGNWFEEILLDVAQEQGQCIDLLPPVKGTTPKEVCIVGSEKGIYYARRHFMDSPYVAAYTQMQRRFNEAGMPYRQLLVEDLLEEGLVPAHKLYIMMPCLVLSESERVALMQRFHREKATVVWLYAAGLYLPGQSPDVQRMENFLGLKLTMSMEKPSTSMRFSDDLDARAWSCWRTVTPVFYPQEGFGEVLARDDSAQPLVVGWKNGEVQHYFSSLPELPNFLYRFIGEKAGVFIYDSGADDPAWIGNDVYFLHAKSDGERALKLPPGLRLRAIIGPFKGSLNSREKWRVHAGQTYGFLVETDK